LTNFYLIFTYCFKGFKKISNFFPGYFVKSTFILISTALAE
jgi:hypothetical protein